MKYSFVLPAYKATFFKEAVDSILTQSYKEFELIIVNDASPEDLDSIVNSYNDTRIRYYKNEKNIGGKDLVAQWNHCLEYAQGDYIILASDDDIYHPEYLEKMDILVNKYPEVNVFRPRIQIIDENNCIKRTYEGCNEKISTIEYIYYLHRDIIGSAISYYIFNKKALLEIGGFINFPRAWGSDDATVMAISLKGMAFEKNVLFSFRMSGKNISTCYDFKTIKSKIYATNKYYDFVQTLTSQLKITNDHERILYNYIIKDLKSLMQRNIRFQIDNALLIDAIKCIVITTNSKWATPLFIIKRVYRLFLKKLITRK